MAKSVEGYTTSLRRNQRIRLGVFVPSPIYYHVPMYRLLSAYPQLDFTAVFASSEGARPLDGGYGRPVSWGIDVLDGYRSVFLHKAAVNKGADDRPFWTPREIDIIPTLLAHHFDVLWLHGYNSLTHVIARLVSGSLGSRVLFREEQTLLEPRPFLKTVIKEVGLRALFAGCRGLYIGSNNYAWFRHYGIPTDRMHPVPYCVDNSRFQEAANRLAGGKARIRQALGISPQSGPVILTVCRLIDKKQPQFLLEAFRRLRQRRQCTLVFVGTGHLEDVLRSTVARENIPDVVFAGFLDQTQVANAYVCADIFVLASKTKETWGVVVNEAMNFGLPIVVSDKVGCAKDLVAHSRNGFVVPSTSIAALEGSLDQLVTSEQLRKRFGAASLEIISGWTYERAVRGVAEAVRAAVGENRWRAATEAVSD